MSADQYLYPFDPTGAATTNLVVGERQTINPPAMDSFYYIVPLAGPYFRESLKVLLYPDAIQLQEGVHYSCSHMFHAATQATGMGIYGSITFFDHTLTGTVSLEYQTLGGDWTISETKIAELLANTLINPRITTWEQAVDVPYQFPPINHEFNITDFVGADDIVSKLQLIVDALNSNNGAGLSAHLADFNNPHQTTKEQVGLGLVENYPVAAVGEAQAGALNNRFMTPLRTRQLVEAIVYDRIDTHVNRTDNPHSTTKAQVGLGNVENYGIATQAESELGASNARYMTPLRVKDAINYQVLNAFNTFIARRDNPHVVTKTQVGLDQVENFPVATIEQAQAGVDSNAYMTPLRTKQAIDALGIGSINAHVSNFNNPHNTTKAQLGLGNVDNYATASQLEAEEATANDKFMTPLRVRQLLAVLGAGSDTHMVDYDNPHQTTKDQVGLGLVENYAVASLLEAQEGTSGTVYMTALRVKQAIDFMLSGGLGPHLTDFDNPHQVTAAQVGSYSIAEIEALLLNKLGTEATAYDAARLFGLDQIAFVTYVGTLLAGDASLVFGMNLSQLAIAVFDQISTIDADTLQGMTRQEIINQAVSQANAGAGTDDNHKKIPAIGKVYDFTDPENPVLAPLPSSWTKIASVMVTNNATLQDVSFIISGGDSFSPDNLSPKNAFNCLVKMVFGEPDAVTGINPLESISSMELSGISGAPTIHYRSYYDAVPDATYIEIWSEDKERRSSLGITKLTGNITFEDVSPVTDVALAITVQPSGLVQVAEVGNVGVVAAFTLIEDTLDELISTFMVP